MQRGSLIAGVLSLLGAGCAIALAVVLRDFVSMYSAIFVVLLLNAAVRFKLASSEGARRPRRP
jgi:hypothetical protein